MRHIAVPLRRMHLTSLLTKYRATNILISTPLLSDQLHRLSLLAYHICRQSQSTPRDLVHGTANEPNIENYMTTHSRASLHGRGRPTMFTNKGARSNPINPSE